MVMEQIANLSTRKCCPGSNPGLSAFLKITNSRSTTLIAWLVSPGLPSQGMVIAPRLGRGGRHA